MKKSVPAALFKHSLASPSIVAKIMYDKYVNALSLKRQEKDYARLGVTLTRWVQAGWINNAAMEHLKPIYDKLHEDLCKRDVIMSDETPCQVHHEDGRKAYVFAISSLNWNERLLTWLQKREKISV